MESDGEFSVSVEDEGASSDIVPKAIAIRMVLDVYES